MGRDAEFYIIPRRYYERKDLNEADEGLWEKFGEDKIYKVKERLINLVPQRWETHRYSYKGDLYFITPDKQLLICHPTSWYYAEGRRIGDWPAIEEIGDWLEANIGDVLYTSDDYEWLFARWTEVKPLLHELWHREGQDIYWRLREEERYQGIMELFEGFSDITN